MVQTGNTQSEKYSLGIFKKVTTCFNFGSIHEVTGRGTQKLPPILLFYA